MLFLLLAPLICFYATAAAEYAADPSFVFLIPSYNNAEWYEKNLDSVRTQSYKKYRIIYVNDASTDGTGDLVASYISKHKLWQKTVLIHNSQRMFMAFNRFLGGHLCGNNEIIVALDGDDWLKHNDVLKDLAHYYKDKRVWMTYGQFEYYPSGGKGTCADIPSFYVHHNTVRKNFWAFMHLRSYYAWLFKLIPEDDFKINDQWMTACTDVPLMYGLLEFAGPHYKFIPHVNYVLNRASPINVCKIAKKLQLKNTWIVRNRKPHRPAPPTWSTRVFAMPDVVQAFLKDACVVQTAP